MSIQDKIPPEAYLNWYNLGTPNGVKLQSLTFEDSGVAWALAIDGSLFRWRLDDALAQWLPVTDHNQLDNLPDEVEAWFTKVR